MDRALSRFHGLVQIWSFECLQVMEEISRKNIEHEVEHEVEENESE